MQVKSPDRFKMSSSSLTAIASVRPGMTAALMAETGLDDAVLTAVVHRFYGKIRDDEVLGPVFEQRIQDWQAHLAKMVDFWSSVALMTGRYSGTPMQVHVPLPVEWPHFERWLALFRDTVGETCGPAGAAHLMERAQRIARSLNMAIEDNRGMGLCPAAAKPRVERHDH